jgi:hypothetical protein
MVSGSKAENRVRCRPSPIEIFEGTCEMVTVAALMDLCARAYQEGVEPLA